MFFLGNSHEVMVELEGMGGGGKLQLEVSFLVKQNFKWVQSSREKKNLATFLICNTDLFLFVSTTDNCL